ncbi:AraC family transcriptional regulator, partial [Klebsiella pneumoniae]
PPPPPLFFIKQTPAYEILIGLVGSEMCIRDRYITHEGQALEKVAFSLGYQSLAAFSRAFKRITGQPPGALRATAR